MGNGRYGGKSSKRSQPKGLKTVLAKKNVKRKSSKEEKREQNSSETTTFDHIND